LPVLKVKASLIVISTRTKNWTEVVSRYGRIRHSLHVYLCGGGASSGDLSNWELTFYFIFSKLQGKKECGGIQEALPISSWTEIDGSRAD